MLAGRVFLVFAYDRFKPLGGGSDLKGVFSDVSEAYAYVGLLRGKGWDTVQVLNVNPLTYVNANV